MSSLLDRAGNLIEDRYPPWNEASTPVPATPALVSLEQFFAIEVPGPGLAVQLPNTMDVRDLPESVLRRPLVVLSFPGFADGRAYSQARLLSRNPRFTGGLRATGAAVVLDQLIMLRHCGVSEFQLRPDQNSRSCAAVLRKVPL